MSLHGTHSATRSAGGPRSASSSHAFRYGNRAPGLAVVRPALLTAARLLIVPLVSAIPFGRRDVAVFGSEDEDLPKDPQDPGLWLYLGVAVALVLLGGVFAGLTIALMGQDETYLQVIATSGEGSEKRHAGKVLGLLKRGKHWVLVTLLLSNVITNETLPIVLDRSLGGGWPAVLSSTVLIVIFGEVVPQSICVRYGLPIGAMMAPPVLCLMWIMCPVAWPTAKLLDWLLGEDHGTMYKKAGLKTLVQLHKTLGSAAGEQLMDDEVTIINSVLDLKDKPVGDIMTPMEDVFTMSADTVLDEKMMELILSQGYSRIPIYAPDNERNFIGMLLVKMLITYDPEDCSRVRDFALATLPETAASTSCLDIINFFQEGKSHMVLVSDYPGEDRGALGVVTLEDVIEEVIGEEIIDESDVFVDVHKAIRRMAPAPRQKFTKNNVVTGEARADEEATDVGEDAPLLPKENGAGPGSRKPSLQGINVLMRRRSSAGSGGKGIVGTAVPVRSNPQELKRHLSHLGPSNAASHPKLTKVKTISIKPGVGTIPENKATTTGINGDDRAAFISSPDGGEGAGLLKSAGKDASDAVQAVQTGYGTLGSPNITARRFSLRSDRQADIANDVDKEPENMTAQEASEYAREHATSTAPAKGSSSPNSLRVPGKVVVGEDGNDESDDKVGDLPPSRERSRSRTKARSGSITETTVDVGGMKKTVLEPGSSSSSEDDQVKSRRTAQGIVNAMPDHNGSADSSDAQVDGTSNGKPKKKRKQRGKKKKGGDGSNGGES